MPFEGEDSGKNGLKLSVIEPFVAAERAAEFLEMTRRRILEMARNGEIPGHPVGHGKRKTWRFRLSELAETIHAQKSAPLALKRNMIETGNRLQRHSRTYLNNFFCERFSVCHFTILFKELVQLYFRISIYYVESGH